MKTLTFQTLKLIIKESENEETWFDVDGEQCKKCNFVSKDDTVLHDHIKQCYNLNPSSSSNEIIMLAVQVFFNS